MMIAIIVNVYWEFGGTRCLFDTMVNTLIILTNVEVEVNRLSNLFKIKKVISKFGLQPIKVIMEFTEPKAHNQNKIEGYKNFQINMFQLFVSLIIFLWFIFTLDYIWFSNLKLYCWLQSHIICYW